MGRGIQRGGEDMIETLFLNQRIAEESQLLAEEKWLVTALNTIRNQRNSLQIERLHLESMRSKLLVEQDSASQYPERPTESPKPTAEDIMQSAPASSRNRIEFEAPLNDEYFSNNEELDLGLASPGYSMMVDETSQDLSNDEDYEDEDDILIDMDMLMTDRTEKDHFILP